MKWMFDDQLWKWVFLQTRTVCSIYLAYKSKAGGEIARGAVNRIHDSARLALAGAHSSFDFDPPWQLVPAQSRLSRSAWILTSSPRRQLARLLRAHPLNHNQTRVSSSTRAPTLHLVGLPLSTSLLCHCWPGTRSSCLNWHCPNSSAYAAQAAYFSSLYCSLHTFSSAISS